MFKYDFDCIDALRCVKMEDNGMRISGSQEWIRSRQEHSSYHHIHKPYDWTYTPHNYLGSPSLNHTVISTSETAVKEIDWDLLKRQEEILYYKRLVLFEDELNDNGLALLHIRLRIMPSCLFMLMQFFLRLEGQIFRVHELRVFYRFDEPGVVVREWVEKEADYEYIRATCTMEQMMNSDHVSQLLPVKHRRIDNLVLLQ